MQDPEDRPPPAKSARAKPSSAHHRGQPSRPARPVDPRFDPMFGASTDIKSFEKNYKFLLEQQDAEEEARRFRIKCLKCVLRRHEIEQARLEARRQEEGSKKKAKRTAEDEDEDEDLSDYEREVFGEDHAQDLRVMKLTPPQHLYRELEQLQRDSQLYVSRRKNTAAVSRKDQVRKALMKKEVSAVKEGAKARPYFPKRSVVKRAVLSDRFEQLEEKGGKGAVDRYLARKTKK